jgi:hypothetical protein
MSTTPRTDDAKEQYLTGKMGIYGVLDEARKLETELVAARSERDLAITRVASILWSGAIDKRTCGDVQQWADDYTAELTRLRAEVEQLTAEVGMLRGHDCGAIQETEEGPMPDGECGVCVKCLRARAEKAEAELAKAKATIEDICTGGRLTCDQCLETMPCNCGHSPRRL